MTWSGNDSRQLPCLFCLNEHSGRMKMDKRGRPYVTCVACGTRSFLHAPEAMMGYALLAGGLMEKLRSGMLGIDQQRVERQHQQLVDSVAGGVEKVA